MLEHMVTVRVNEERGMRRMAIKKLALCAQVPNAYIHRAETADEQLSRAQYKEVTTFCCRHA